ncbi:hypothetical protein [Runella sp.]|uniref:hypothetical protein n=1 Tax=Runella sp. TaxID=1960881 RepID=UPI003D14AF50
MVVTFEIEPSELDENFLQKLRSLFGHGKLKIIVEENKEAEISDITKSIAKKALQSSEVLSFTPEEFEIIASKMNNGEAIDTESFKITLP